MAKNVVGLFENQSDAQGALSDLQSAGFSSDNVNVLRGASGASSGIFDQLGIPQQDASIYMQGIQSGGAMVILQQLSDSDANRAADILDRHNIVDINSVGQGFGQTSSTTGFTQTEQTTTTSTAGMSTGATTGMGTGSRRSSSYQGGETVIPIVEEQLEIGKREVEGGGVRVNTHVEQVPVNEQVSLRDEEVHVERRRVNQPLDAATAGTAFQEGTFEVTETDEQAVVSKEARVVEEVVVSKDVQQRTENVQDTVRRTDVDVEEVGGTRTTRRTDDSSSSM